MDGLLSQQEQAFLAQLLAIPGCNFEEAIVAARALAQDAVRPRTDKERSAISSIYFKIYAQSRYRN